MQIRKIEANELFTNPAKFSFCGKSRGYPISP